MWPFTRNKEAEEARTSPESPTFNLSDPNLLAILWGDYGKTGTGILVNAQVALQVSSVWSAVNFIASTIAALPLDLYERNGDDRKHVNGGSLAGILHDWVNEDRLTSFEWRRLSMQNILLHGRSFTFVQRDGAGKALNLYPLNPREVRVEKQGNNRVYRYQDKKNYAAADIIDVPWMLAEDGLSHYVPVQQFKQAISLALALESYACKFFENGGIPPLALHGPMPTTPAGAKRASQDVDAALKSAQQDKRNILVLPSGHELKPIGVDPRDSQMEEGRRFCVEEFARWFGLPPVFLQDLSRATFTNSEQQDLHFVKHSLIQWLKRWEQELNAKLFGRTNTKNFVEFNQDYLLRGDFASRMAGYASGIQNGFLEPNEVRAMENRPASSQDGADKLYIQGATVPLGTPPKAATPPSPSPAAGTGTSSDVSTP